VSKKKKRLERMRRNKYNVSYGEFLMVLEEFGYVVRNAKGAHRGAKLNLKGHVWQLTFVEPHEGKFVHHKDVERLLKHIDEIEALQGTTESEETEYE
jgi:hypothetical protein